MSDRVAEWASVLTDGDAPGRGGRRVADRVRSRRRPRDLGRLIGAEQRCCAFFNFALTVDAGGIALEVRAPELAAEMITDLFGAAA